MPPKPSPTHFLCIPLVTRASRPQLTQSLASFRAEVSERGSPVGGLGALPGSLNVVPEEAIRPVGSLHLTLGVFSFPRKPKSGSRNAPGGSSSAAAAAADAADEQVLPKEQEQEEEDKLETAKALLQSLRPREILKAYKPPPAMPGSTVIPGSVSEESSEEEELKITLRGLRSMQSTTPQKSAVLYAPPVDPRGRLQQFCEGVRKVFQDAGLMVSEDRPLLLHATVVNTIYVKGRKTQGQGQSRGTGRGRGRGGGRHNHRERLTIDATGILDRFEDHVWMEDVKVEKIAICKMGARKVEVDGVVVDEEYEVVGEVDV